MKAPILLPLLLACTDYNLQGEGKEPPAGGDTGEGGEELPPEDTGEDSGAPGGDSSEPPEEELPPEAALEPMYAHTAGRLYSVSPEPPYDWTPIGDFTDESGWPEEVTDIAIDSGGIMYAVSFTTLYRVDATNAALTRVGLTSASDLNALTFLADGTLLAGGGSALYEVDTSTGGLTRMASIGSWTFAGDMVGLPDGLLYCAMTEGWGSAVSLVVYDMAAREIVDSGSTGTDSLYGVAYAEETLFGFSATGEVYTLDPSTGLGTWIAEAGSVWYGATTNPVAWD